VLEQLIVKLVGLGKQMGQEVELLIVQGLMVVIPLQHSLITLMLQLELQVTQW